MSKTKFTSLRVVADKILRDPIFIGLTFESIIDYFVDFITIVGSPQLFDEKITEVPLTVANYRATLPLDFIEEVQMSINNRVARTATDSFAGFYTEVDANKPEQEYFQNTTTEVTYKIKGDYIYFSVKEGTVMLSYKCIMTDEDEESEDYGIPLLPDDPVFILALKSYIEVEWLKILYRSGKISNQILDEAKQSYAWNVGRYETHSKRLTLGDMESISKMFKSLVARNNEFKTRFKHLGTR